MPLLSETTLKVGGKEVASVRARNNPVWSGELSIEDLMASARAWWTTSDYSGTGDLLDKSGNGHDLIVHSGGPTWVSEGSYFDFEGELKSGGSHVESLYLEPNALDWSGPFTVILVSDLFRSSDATMWAGHIMGVDYDTQWGRSGDFLVWGQSDIDPNLLGLDGFNRSGWPQRYPPSPSQTMDSSLSAEWVVLSNTHDGSPTGLRFATNNVERLTESFTHTDFADGDGRFFIGGHSGLSTNAQPMHFYGAAFFTSALSLQQIAAVVAEVRS
jgi:hypothetical protein